MEKNKYQNNILITKFHFNSAYVEFIKRLSRGLSIQSVQINRIYARIYD